MLRGPHPRAVVVEEMLRRGARVEASRELLNNPALRPAVSGDAEGWKVLREVEGVLGRLRTLSLLQDIWVGVAYWCAWGVK